jgi:hypothetical protein
MPAHNLLTRVPRHFEKTVTFTGLTGAGLINETVAVGTVTGRILIVYGCIECTTDLAGASATVSVGTANNVAGIVAVTTATDIDANDIWRDASPEVEISPAISNINVGANIIIDVLVANVSAGVLVFDLFWLPMSTNGNLA